MLTLTMNIFIKEINTMNFDFSEIFNPEFLINFLNLCFPTVQGIVKELVICHYSVYEGHDKRLNLLHIFTKYMHFLRLTAARSSRKGKKLGYSKIVY